MAMNGRQIRNSIVVPDDSSEDSSPPAEVQQEENANDADSEVSVPLAQVKRALDTPTASPITTRPLSPPLAAWISPARRAALELPTVEAVADTKSYLNNLGWRSKAFPRAGQEDVDSPLNSVKSLSPPPENSTATRIGPDRYPPPENANASLTGTTIELPPAFNLTDLHSRFDMDSNLNERRTEFQAESAKLRADSKFETTNKENDELVHVMKTSLESAPQAAAPSEMVQPAMTSSPCAPVSGFEGEANVESDIGESKSVDQSFDSTENEDGSTGEASRQRHRGTTPEEETIAEVILSEASKTTRPILTKGDAAIIMDTSDLTSTLLISCDRLSRAAPDLCKTALDPGAPLRFVVLVDQRAHLDRPRMCLLSTVNPKLTPTEFFQKHHIPETRSRKAFEERKSNNNVKNEDQEDHSEEMPKDALETDWKKAYETVFAIIEGVSRTRIFRMLSDNKSPLLVQIEGAIAIAKKYNMLESLETAFSLLLLDFINHDTLWKAIHKNPAHWLMIGVTIQNDIFYKEAFKHMCGSYPACVDDAKLASLTNEVMALVERKSRDLCYLRLAIDQELLTLNLQPNPKNGKKKSGKAASLDEEMEHYSHSSVAYQTRAYFRDYICEQIRLLEPTADKDQAKSKHHLNSFYYAIQRGGDAYLPADNVVDDWEHEDVPFDEGKVREKLKRLKSAASVIVTPLTRSTLQYEGKDGLEYLTCVDVEESDVPWKKDEDVEMEDD